MNYKIELKQFFLKNVRSWELIAGLIGFYGV